MEGIEKMINPLITLMSIFLVPFFSKFAFSDISKKSTSYQIEGQVAQQLFSALHKCDVTIETLSNSYRINVHDISCSGFSLANSSIANCNFKQRVIAREFNRFEIKTCEIIDEDAMNLIKTLRKIPEIVTGSKYSQFITIEQIICEKDLQSTISPFLYHARCTIQQF